MFYSKSPVMIGAIYLSSYYAAIGLAMVIDLRVPPILTVVMIPSIILIALASERRRQSGTELEQWLNLRSSVPYGLVFAAIALLPYNLSTLIQAF